MKDDRSRSICLLQTINRNMRRCVEKKVAGTGVFRSQHKLLMTLGNHQDCSQTELAEKLASGMIPEQKNKKTEEMDAQKKLLEWEQEYRTRRRQ